MKERLKKIFARNNKEMEIIDNNKKLSKEAREDRKKILDSENKKIENYQKVLENNTNEIISLELSKNDDRSTIKINQKEKILQSEIEDAIKEIRCGRQGKVKDIISAFLGQKDKKIHNFIFKDTRNDGKETVFRDKLWNFHKNAVEDRYSDIDSFIKRNAILIGSLALSGLFVTKGGLSLLGQIVCGIGGVLALDTTIKTISTKYNLKKFERCPKLERIKNILNGKYKENIETSIYANTKSTILNNQSFDIQELQEDVKPIKLNIEQQNIEHLKIEENNITNIQEISTKPNIEDYANMVIVGQESKDLSFAKAISIVRNKKFSYEDKIDAYARLAYTFGKNKGNKKNEVIKKCLNDFNKTEKLLSQYGKMIDLRKKELVNNGLDIQNDVLLKQYTNRYLELTYHLGNVNDDYSYEDFIADEALRYANDLQKYNEENAKVMKKAM